MSLILTRQNNLMNGYDGGLSLFPKPDYKIPNKRKHAAAMTAKRKRKPLITDALRKKAINSVGAPLWTPIANTL